MHVLLIIEGTYPWYRGGVSEWVYQYLKNLSVIKFTILQVATDEFQGLDPRKALYPLTDNIENFIRISPPSFSGAWEDYCNNWYNSIIKEVDIFGWNYDLIHVTNTGFAGWLGATISRTVEKPLILTEHAVYWKEVEMGAVALECGYKIPNKSYEKAAVVSSFKEMARFTYSESDQILTVSNSNIPLQRSLGAEFIKYIPNGIPGSWLVQKKQRGEAPVIAWVGRCAAMKNPLAFFDLVDEFETTDLEPEFVMMLSDANEKHLEMKVRALAKHYQQVKCIWNKPAKEHFNKFDLLVITSNNESQPLVMLEALAHKALPVGHKVGDLTGKYGFVFEADTPFKTVANEITKLWSDRKMFEHLIQERFELVSRSHTWESIFNEYRLLMNSVCKRQEIG